MGKAFSPERIEAYERAYERANGKQCRVTYERGYYYVDQLDGWDATPYRGKALDFMTVRLEQVAAGVDK
jgi:hypothetical protein